MNIPKKGQKNVKPITPGSAIVRVLLNEEEVILLYDDKFLTYSLQDRKIRYRF